MYLNVLKERVVVFDGAMGTSIQALGLSAADFGGPSLEGCNDYLVITRPDAIEGIHAAYLEAGADVLETDTFRSNPLTLREYDLQDRVIEINRAAAALARKVADQFSTPDRPRFVAGSIGPSGFLPSTSDPSLGNITYRELVDVFYQQAKGLAEGGVDLMLVETSQDILEVKAQVAGIRKYFRDAGKSLPIQAQVTLDTSERMLLGTDIAAAMQILESLRVDVLGLNCSVGPEHMRQPVRYLCEHSRLPISVIPNAGLPINDAGRAIYPLTPDELAIAHEEFVTRFGVSIVGGCCGTTPDHIKAVVDRVWGKKALPRKVRETATAASAMTAMSLVQDPAPALIGERVNSQGSRAVKRMLLSDDYEGILTIARDQVEGGGHFLDVCVALTERQDEAEQMRKLVKLLAQSVETPLVIDSTEADVIQAALEQYPGRAIVNSINLENGRQRIEAVMPHVVEHGAAVIALTIDEQGMAKTAQRKLEIARRITDIVTKEYGLEPNALIFDDLTFTLATGDQEFRRSAIETIDGIRAIKSELPGVLTSLGVSNVSFGLAKHARSILNSVFLHHCVEAGLDMAIVNPAHITPYAEINEAERVLADDLIFDRREDALARFIAHFDNTEVQQEAAIDPTATMDPDQALHWKILHRKKEGIEQLIDEAISAHGGGDPGGIWVLNNTLLPAMKEVGDKFGAGELILPFVLQSAEVMKKAVARLETYLDKVEGQTKGKVVLATVFGDVHDIGKSLVNTILSNNGYTVYDLGKQVPVNTIIEKAQEVNADAIGLSALLVSTSKQMPLCVQELHSRGLTYPVLCGGAAINPSFIRSASFVNQEQGELYGPGVFYCKDAFEGLSTIEVLTNPDKRGEFVSARHQEVREGVARRAELQARARAARPPGANGGPSKDVDVPEPTFFGVKTIEKLPLADLFRYIDLNTLYRLHWGAKNTKGEEYEKLVKDEFEPRLKKYQQEALNHQWFRPRAVYGFFPAAAQGNDLVIFDPTDSDREIERFEFPRQTDRDLLCLADYFTSVGNNKRDVVGFQLVTVGDELLERSETMMKGGDYSEGYYLHGFGVRIAEAAAEYVHRLMRKELGIPMNRGLRYSWGYPACPDHMQHEILYRLLPAREMGMGLTEWGALVPELSTAALVVHHPEAKYFST